MLRRQRQIHAQIQKLVDAGLFALSFWLAHLIRSRSQIAVFGGTAEIQPFEEFLWLYLLIIPFSFLVLEYQGFYNRPLITSRRWLIWDLLKGCTLMVMAVIVVMFLLRVQLARSVVILFGPVSFIVVLCKEELLRSWLRSKVGQAQMKRHVIVAGTHADVDRLKAELKVDGADDVEVVAVVNLNEVPIDDLVNLVHEHSANAVLVNAKHTLFGRIEKAIQVCELEGVEVWLLADFFQTQISRTTLDEFHGRPMLVFRSTPEMSWQAVAKQVIDVLGAFVFLLVLAPLLLIIALIIKLTSPGPVLFRQQRSGLNGKPFTMLKFRSMVTDAEQRKRELEAFNEMSGPVFKVTNDPRITRMGRWLRRWSLDEFPQLVNVLRGEMSLVGPRPLPVDEVRRFDDMAHRRRLSVRPGLTCLWQIRGRNNLTDFKEWVRLDLEYIDNWSLWLDLEILCKTIPVVLMGAGAK